MKISKIRDVKTPTRGTDRSAGLDFYIPNDWNDGKKYDLWPKYGVNISSGIKAKIPEGYALIFFNKSGVATNKNLQVGACVVDEDYQGEIHLHVWNVGNKLTQLVPGDKLVQGLLIPVKYENVEEVDEAELFPTTTQRGEGGFGSTGSD